MQNDVQEKDIGGFFYHHCLNFLFITNKKEQCQKYKKKHTMLYKI